eukprot:403357084
MQSDPLQNSTLNIDLPNSSQFHQTNPTSLNLHTKNFNEFNQLELVVKRKQQHRRKRAQSSLFVNTKHTIFDKTINAQDVNTTQHIMKKIQWFEAVKGDLSQNQLISKADRSQYRNLSTRDTKSRFSKTTNQLFQKDSMKNQHSKLDNQSPGQNIIDFSNKDLKRFLNYNTFRQIKTSQPGMRSRGIQKQFCDIKQSIMSTADQENQCTLSQFDDTQLEYTQISEINTQQHQAFNESRLVKSQQKQTRNLSKLYTPGNQLQLSILPKRLLNTSCHSRVKSKSFYNNTNINQDQNLINQRDWDHNTLDHQGEKTIQTNSFFTYSRKKQRKVFGDEQYTIQTKVPSFSIDNDKYIQQREKLRSQKEKFI